MNENAFDWLVVGAAEDTVLKWGGNNDVEKKSF